MTDKCPTCGAPAGSSAPDGEFRYRPPRPTPSGLERATRWLDRDYRTDDFRTTDERLAAEFARVRREALEQAAQLCDEYADENMRICQDNIVLDPVLHGDLSEAAMIRGKEMIIDSCVHSSMYHAANSIAAAIRRLMEEPKQ